MRKPLLALSLAVAVAGLAALPAEALAAQSATKSTHSSSARASANSVSGAQIVQTALRYLGVPYSLTGATPKQGFSCIGFVSYVYHLNGIALPGDLGGAIAYAPQVPFSQLQPGDILYFQNTIWTGLSHAAIYIGGGRFVHSEWFGYGGVRISSFNNDPRDGNYWITKYLGANRPWGGPSLAPVVTDPTGSVTPPTTSVVRQVQGGTAATVTVSSLNVRSGPSKSNSVQQVVGKGESLTIIGKSGGWDKVQLPDGTIGWVVNYGVASTTSATSSVANPTVGNPSAQRKVGSPTTVRRLPQVGVRVASLNVHSSPSVSAPVIGGVVKGQKVQVLSRSGGWMKVRTPTGFVGWIVSSYTTGSRRSTATQRYSPAKVGSTLSGPTLSSRVSGLRIHSWASTSSGVVGSLAVGQKAQIIARSGGWVKVRTSSGVTGWVVSSYTSAGGSSITYAAMRSSRVNTRGPVVTVGARVHAAPGLKARVVGLVAAGTHVTVLGYRAGWAWVRLPSGMTGYVYGSFVR